MIGGAGLLIFGVYLIVSGGINTLTLLSPLSGQQEKTVEKKKPTILGFLPTWMVGKTRTYGEEITDLVFLGVEVSEDGSLVWDIQSKKLNNDNYLALKENINKTGGKNILGIKLFDDDKIDTLLTDEEAKTKLMTEVRNVMVAGNFAGVNIDFEYMSNPTRILDDDFGAFLDQIGQAGWGEVSIDVFANTIIKGDSERLKKMMTKVDKVVVMAYDFHRPGSDYAGPVAPIGADVGERSISEIVQKTVDFGLNKKQIIMAYPFYGYEWETDDEILGGATKKGGYGKTVFYKETTEKYATSSAVKWDELSMTPWLTYIEKEEVKRSVKVGRKWKTVTEIVDQPHQVYFENLESLKAKIQLAYQSQIDGVGFWALGYEGEKYDVWEMVLRVLKNGS